MSSTSMPMTAGPAPELWLSVGVGVGEHRPAVSAGAVGPWPMHPGHDLGGGPVIARFSGCIEPGSAAASPSAAAWFTLGAVGALGVVAVIAGVGIGLCRRTVAAHYGVEPEACDLVGVAEELVLDERLDVVHPDPPQALVLLVR